MPGGRGRVRCPRARPHQPHARTLARSHARTLARSRGPGIMSAGITAGVRGASLELGRQAFPRSLARIAPRDYTPLGQSRGGTPAGERARKRRAAQAATSWRDPRAACVRGLTTVRLPAFRFPYFLKFPLPRATASGGEGIGGLRPPSTKVTPTRSVGYGWGALFAPLPPPRLASLRNTRRPSPPQAGEENTWAV